MPREAQKLHMKSGKETEALGRALGKKLKSGILCLYGDLGAGKTTLVRGLAAGMGIDSRIQSPTFTYVRIHGKKKKLYHFDCYRVPENDHELHSEFREIAERKDGIIAMEWAEKVVHWLPHKRTDIHFKYINENTRELTILEYD